MTVLGKRSRTSEGSTETGTAADGKSGKRTRSAAVNIAFAVDLEVVTGHVQWGHLGLEPRMEAQQFSVVEGVDSAVSAWVAGRCNRVWGQESSPEEEKQHAELAQAAKTRELDAWRKFDVNEPRQICGFGTNCTDAMGLDAEDSGCKEKRKGPDGGEGLPRW